MFVRQRNPDANENARQETDDKTKPGRVAHRAVTEVKDSGRLISVHRQESAPVVAERKKGHLQPSLESIWN